MHACNIKDSSSIVANKQSNARPNEVRKYIQQTTVNTKRHKLKNIT